MLQGSLALAENMPSPLAFTYGLRVATESAALACHALLSRGDRAGAARASARAMRTELERLGLHGTVVAGEAMDASAPSLLPGFVLGDPDAPRRFDIAVDPAEGTSYVAAAGGNNALSVLALAPAGTLFRPGPAFYMEKFAAPPAVRGQIDPAAPVAQKLRVLADCLDKPVSALTIYVLEKPRHRALVDAIQREGARVALHAAGDVAGALMAAIPGSGVDAMMGTGGMSEGILTACAVRALGGEFFGRVNPQLNTERMAVHAAGMDTTRWLGLDDLVASDAVQFCATGIADGLLLEGVTATPEGVRTQTLLIAGGGHGRQVITSWRRD